MVMTITAAPKPLAARPVDVSAFLTPRALALWQASIDATGGRSPIEIVGQSDVIEALLIKLDKIRKYSEPVLITGDSGVGKEWFARAVHLLSPRHTHPLVTVNCPQFQEGNLTVSELFGH